MTAHTVYRTFNTDRRREFVRITDDVAEAVAESGIREGMVLVCAMHITAGVWINDDEPGILEDTLEWLDKLAPPSWKEPANDVAAQPRPRPRRLPPPPRTARTTATRTGRTCSSTTRWSSRSPTGRLDLGPWQAVFYAEFDGGRDKRLVIKVLGE